MKTAQAGNLRIGVALMAMLSLVLAPVAQAQRTQLKPGWNMYSVEQDVELGRQVAAQAEKELPMMNDRRVDNYLNNLGRRLASKAPGPKFPYQFKGVNDSAINAFALPGGFLYVNRGIIESADNEAQLAGVMAHEISHAALRHGTNQASKQQIASVPLAILGGVVGNNSVGALAAQIGAGVLTQSILLKYSRDAERQADTMGVQILYDNGYDPRAMAQFFEKIQAERKGGRTPEFFSSHPNPENRVQLSTAEVQRLGGAPRNYKTDSAEFRDIKRYVTSLPAAPRNVQGQQASGGTAQSNGRPADPSGRYQRFQSGRLTMDYPDNWRAYGQGDAATFAPEGGLLQDRQGNTAVAYGMLINLYEPHDDGYSTNRITLEQATDQLIDELRRGNPNMRISQEHERIRLGGARGLSTILTNSSPLGGQEVNWLVTVLRPEGLLFFVSVSPQNEFNRYDNTFEHMLDSVRFTTTGSSLRNR